MKSIQKYIRYALALLLTASLAACGTSKPLLTKTADTNPKYEFRGAWIQTAWQDSYAKMSSSSMAFYLKDMVRKLDEAGINAVIFQVRPEADAFYKSNLEPWSRFMTGVQGKAPDDPTFDPLALLIEECHSRGMELHAWLNPYRAQSSLNSRLADNHPYRRNPERFIKYGNQLFFDPGLPENRTYFCEIVRDIVSRYDVDAIHIDDYFYPYPIAGTQFLDDRSFSMYAASQGFSSSQRDDWRRNNVNLLIQQVKYTIAGVKPWVRFGVSPFGIYRNKRNDPNGSNTTGLQNYDDLYADIKLWVEKGWIDYNMPQLYWEIGHSAADYSTLLTWWNTNNFKQPLYIGQDLKRSLDKNEMDTKIRQSRQMNFVSGNCYWYGSQIVDNYNNVFSLLQTNLHKSKSLIPPYTHMHKGKPAPVKKLTESYTSDMHFISWQHIKNPNNPEAAQRFVVYRFRKGEKVDLNKAQNIVDIINDNFFVLPYEGGCNVYTYVVTPLDAFWNEGKGQKIRVRL